MRIIALVTALGMALGTAASAQHVSGFENDYPTEARADYVFACMVVNGNTRSALSQCSCSIDVIASILTYEQYVEAETVMSLRLIGGERVGVMRTAPMANQAVAALRRAQAEAELRCF